VDRVVPHSLAHASSADLGEPAISVDAARDILQHIAAASEVNLVGVEEAQFFDGELMDVIQLVSGRGIDIVLSLLDQDFRRRPFPVDGARDGRTVGAYLAMAHESLKLTAVCMSCGADAQHSQKLVLSGMSDEAEPIYLPASIADEIVAVGTGRELAALDSEEGDEPGPPPHIYEARCRECHELPDDPYEPPPAKAVGEAAAAETQEAEVAASAPVGIAEEGEEVELVDADDFAPAPEPEPPVPEEQPVVSRPIARDDLPDLLELAD
jgi:thymidine kinase